MGIGARLKVVFSWFWAFIWPTIQELMAAYAERLAESCLRAVRDAETALGDGGGTEKFQMAVQQVCADMAAAGWEVGTCLAISTVHRFIELAHAKMVKESGTGG